MLLIPFTFYGSSFFQELLYINDLFSFSTLWSLQLSGSRKHPHCLIYIPVMLTMNKRKRHCWTWFRHNCKSYIEWEIPYSLGSSFVSLTQYIQMHLMHNRCSVHARSFSSFYHQRFMFITFLSKHNWEFLVCCAGNDTI